MINLEEIKDKQTKILGTKIVLTNGSELLTTEPSHSIVGKYLDDELIETKVVNLNEINPFLGWFSDDFKRA